MSYGKRAGLGAGLMEVGKGVGAYTQFNIEDMRQKNLDAIRKQERGEDLAHRAEREGVEDRNRADDVTRRDKEFLATIEDRKTQTAAAAAERAAAREDRVRLNFVSIGKEYDDKMDDVRAARRKAIENGDDAGIRAADDDEASILKQKVRAMRKFSDMYPKMGLMSATDDAPASTDAPSGVGDGSLLRLDQSDGAVPAAADKGIQSKVDARLGDTPLMSVPTAGSEDKVSVAARDLGLTLQPTTGEVIGNAASKAKDAVFGAVSAVGSKMAENSARAARTQAKIDLASAIDANGKVNRAKVESLASSGLDAASLRKIGANDKIIALIERIRAAQ